MAKDMISIYMKQVEKIPLLSVEEERELIKKACSGNKAARDKIINSNLRFVVKIANAYKNRGVELEDLICEGNAALIKAIEKMDPSKEVRFITYASFWIKQYMKAAIYKTGRCVAIPQNRGDLLKDSNFTSVSLDKPINQDDANGATPMENLSAENYKSTEDIFLEQALCEDFSRVLPLLKEKERMVIVKHYGLDGKKPMSLRDIGESLNMSREGVRQIEARALLKLRSNNLIQTYEYAA